MTFCVFNETHVLFFWQTDDIAELEWVSHFVDDSVSDVSLLVPACKGSSKRHAKNRFEPETKPTFAKTSCLFPSRVPSKARTKRSRPTGRTWSAGSNQSETPSSSTSSTSSMPCLVATNTVQTADSLSWLSEQPMKISKKRPAVHTSGLMASTQFQRRCSHCQVQKTPQWRTGPLGAKTLCNACGVRYKSGRLFPEYRPACSPTFSSEVHSNSHRKVLEMRRKKEVAGAEPRLNQMVPSFWRLMIGCSHVGLIWTRVKPSLDVVRFFNLKTRFQQVRFCLRAADL